jgi:hypothetical protein
MALLRDEGVWARPWWREAKKAGAGQIPPAMMACFSWAGKAGCRRRLCAILAAGAVGRQHAILSASGGASFTSDRYPVEQEGSS